MPKSWLPKLKPQRLLPKSNLQMPLRNNKKLSKLKWLLKQLREQDNRNWKMKRKLESLQPNRLLKRLLKQLRKKLMKKRKLEKLLSLLLIDNLSKMRKMLQLRKLASLKKLKMMRQPKQLLNKLPLKLLLIWLLQSPRMKDRELLLIRKKPKQLHLLPNKQRKLPYSRNNILRKILERRDWLLSLLKKLQEKLKQLKQKLKLKLPIGPDKLWRLLPNLSKNRPLPLLLLLPKRQNLKLRDRELKQSMMPLLSFKLRPIDLPLWQLRQLTRLQKLLEELVKRSKLQLIRDRWLLVDLLSRKPSEMCGPPETLECHSST